VLVRVLVPVARLQRVRGLEALEHRHQHVEGVDDGVGESTCLRQRTGSRTGSAFQPLGHCTVHEAHLKHFLLEQLARRRKVVWIGYDPRGVAGVHAPSSPRGATDVNLSGASTRLSTRCTTVRVGVHATAATITVRGRCSNRLVVHVDVDVRGDVMVNCEQA
jgi:hypothetical protein